MTLIFEEEGDLKLDIPCQELAELVINATIDYVACPYETEISLRKMLTISVQYGRRFHISQRNSELPKTATVL